MSNIKHAVNKYNNNPAASAIMVTEDWWKSYKQKNPEKARDILRDCTICFTEHRDNNCKVLLDNGKII